MTGILSYSSHLTPVCFLHTEKELRKSCPLYLIWNFLRPPSDNVAISSKHFGGHIIADIQKRLSNFLAVSSIVGERVPTADMWLPGGGASSSVDDLVDQNISQLHVKTVHFTLN